MSEYNFEGLDQVAPPQAVASQQTPSSSGGGGYNFDGVDEIAKEQKFSTPPQILKTAVEGALRGATLGGSDYAETRLGIAEPEDIRAREDINPGTAITSNIGGSAALIGLTGGVAAPAEGALLATKVAPIARALAYGAEGATFGLGNTISDASLGDTKINAQKVLTDIGMGAAFGAGLGALSKGIEASPSLFRKASIPEAAVSSVEDAAHLQENPNPIVDAPSRTPTTGINPTSLEDIKARVKDASYRGEEVQLPAKDVLEDAASRIEMLNPVHPLQLDSMSSQASRDLYQTAKEMAGSEGDALRNYEGLQKQELTKLTDKTIQSLAPESKVISDATEAGNHAIKAFTDNYQEEQKALAPLFENFKKIESSDPMAHLPGMIDKITDAVPSTAKMFETEGGEIALKPYKTSMGIDKATYTAVKEAVNSLEENPSSIQDLFNIRKGLDQHVDVMAQGAAPAEIRGIKAAMMDYIQGEIEKVGAATGENVDVRDIFRRYAINEQEREVIQKAFGASVGSPEFGSLSKVKPEEVLDKIFKNSATTKAARSILGEAKFNELLANHLAEQRALATDKGAFSGNKFGSYLKKNQDVLNEAMSNNPDALQRLKDINNITRILPDATSINPSGTAKTLWGILKAHSIPEFISNLKEFGEEKLSHKVIIDDLNNKLSGKADQATKLSTLKKIITRTDDKIEDSAKSIFSGMGRSLGTAGLTAVSTEEYNKRVNRIRELSTDPTAMMDHLDKSTKAMYAAAPNISSDIQNSMTQSLNFLASKIPAPSNHMPLSPTFKPSIAQVEKFNKYYAVVNDPLISLKQVKNGALTYETMDALSASHPDLLKEMRSKVIEQFDPEEAKSLPYSVKISLAKFLGEPLEQNMLPQVISSFQNVLNPPNPSAQESMGKNKPTLGGMKQLKIAENSETRMRFDADPKDRS